MPPILCIETATPLCSVALVDGDKLLAERNAGEPGRLTHAERLSVFVEEVIREAGSNMHDLQAVAVGIGPGSFTGLRIGISSTKGYCYALGIPIIGISTLHTLTAALRSSPQGDRTTNNEQPLDRLGKGSTTNRELLHPMIDARRMEVFTQAFGNAGLPMGEVHAQVLDDAWIEAFPVDRQVIVFGDGADKATELWKSHQAIMHVPGIKPSARAMAPEAVRRLAAKEFDDLAYLVPSYGKEARVTQSRRAGADH